MADQRIPNPAQSTVDHVRLVLERVKRNRAASYFDSAQELAEEVVDALDLYEDSDLKIPPWIIELARTVFSEDPRIHR